MSSPSLVNSLSLSSWGKKLNTGSDDCPLELGSLLGVSFSRGLGSANCLKGGSLGSASSRTGGCLSTNGFLASGLLLEVGSCSLGGDGLLIGGSGARVVGSGASLGGSGRLGDVTGRLGALTGLLGAVTGSLTGSSGFCVGGGLNLGLDGLLRPVRSGLEGSLGSSGLGVVGLGLGVAVGVSSGLLLFCLLGTLLLGDGTCWEIWVWAGARLNLFGSLAPPRPPVGLVMVTSWDGASVSASGSSYSYS